MDPVQSAGDEKPENTRLETDDNEKKSDGLSYGWAAVFVAANIAGSGVLPMASAIVNAGWIGFVLIVVTCFSAGYLGIVLGRCWLLLQERKPELYAGQCRTPWAAIGFEVLGPCGRSSISLLNNIGLFGVSIVFLILCADNIQDIAKDAIPQMNTCLWLIVVAGALWPFTWVGSPKDFWWAGLAALLSTVIALIMIYIQAGIDAPSTRADIYYTSPTLESFFTALPTIMFAFGGASTFPTIQNDMINKSEFVKSVGIAFVGLLLIFLPAGACGYYVYGAEVDPNILKSLTDGVPKTIGLALIAAHVFFAFILISNPIYQSSEELLKIPSKFGWKRIVLRSSLLLLALFIAESVPSFGKILDLVSGTTVSLLTFTLPPYFYMKLADMKGPTWEPTPIPLHERVFLWEMVFIGLGAGIVSTYFAIAAIAGQDGGFDSPCYIHYLQNAIK